MLFHEEPYFLAEGSECESLLDGEVSCDVAQEKWVCEVCADA